MSRPYTEAELEEMTLATKSQVTGLWDLSVAVGAFPSVTKAKQINKAAIIEAILSAQEKEENLRLGSPSSHHMRTGSSPTDYTWRCDECKQQKKSALVSYRCTKCPDFELCTSCFKEPAQLEHARKLGAAHRTYKKVNGKNSGQHIDADIDDADIDDELSAAMERQVVIACVSTVRKPRAPFNTAPTLVVDVRLKQTGMALLIGNSRYDRCELLDLPYCANDLDKMRDVLESLGFTVCTHEDLEGRDIMRVVEDASEKATEMKDAPLFAFYYTGHGCLNANNHDVLIGVDGEKVRADDIINQFNPGVCGALGGQPKLAIFDCCRDPDEEAVSAIEAMSPATKGLHSRSQVNAVIDVDYANWWIMRAAAKGYSAPARMASRTVKHSPLTHYLAPALDELLSSPNMTLSDVETNVNHRIHEDLQARKVPAMLAEVLGTRRCIIKFTDQDETSTDAQEASGAGFMTPQKQKVAAAAAALHTYSRSELEDLILADKGSRKGLYTISQELGVFDSPSAAKKAKRSDIIDAIINFQK